MISFAWPWLALLLIFPVLVWLLVPAAKSRKDASLCVPNLERFEIVSSSQMQPRKPGRNHWLAYLLWVGLVSAVMRPQWLGDPVNLPVSGRDLMLGVDISGSMREDDFAYQGRRVSRLSVVRELGRQFIERREGDRIGLILFGDNAYIQTPLTHDRATVQHFLGEAVVGLAGKATAIGDAIGLAVKRLRTRPQESRVLILLTDGANTAGEVEPLDAAAVASKFGIRIYTIGVGSDVTANRSVFGFPIGGRTSDLDENSLIKIAESTGGRYFRARNSEEMEQIYHIIDDLEPTEEDSQTLRPRKELFSWPLGFVLISSLLWIFAAQQERRI